MNKLRNFVNQTLAFADRVGQLLKDLRTEVDANTSEISDINNELPTLAKKADVYTKSETDAEINAKIAGVYKFKESVDTYADLPPNAEPGWVYDVKADGKNYARLDDPNGGENGDGWDDLGGFVDLTDYATKAWADDKFEPKFSKKSAFNLDKASESQAKSGTSDSVSATPKSIATYIDDKIGDADPLQEFNDIYNN